MRNSISIFLRLRFKQGLRELQATGGLGIILALVLTLGGFYWYTQKLQEAWHYALLPGLILLSLHFSRSDHRFLQINFHPFKCKILLAEYLLLSLPFAIINLVYYLPGALILLVLAGLLPFIPPLPNLRTRFHLPGMQWVPNAFFEWKSGLRQNPISWLLVLVVPFLMVVHPAFPILAWVLELLILTSLYKECEDWRMVQLDYQSPSALVFKKFLLHFSTILVVNLPSLLLFSILNSEYYWVSLVFTALLAFNLFYGLVCKYAFYQPNRVQSPNQIWVSIGLISLLFPPFLPLPFIMSIRFYRKTLSNLQIYFDA
ncbi:MAG: hypothetical protein K1X82_01745 [Bacteroidia bacterium]|nr:hypothetical protein [Bacteroidia bacterium]